MEPRLRGKVEAILAEPDSSFSDEELYHLDYDIEDILNELEPCLSDSSSESEKEEAAESLGMIASSERVQFGCPFEASPLAL